MNVLILGSGGREHALAWKIVQSPKLKNLFIAPGNAGTASCGTNVTISDINFEEVKKFCIENQVNMIIVGPEAPLVEGIWDYFKKHLPECKVIGASKKGALLEGSKDFAKEFMKRHNIPTANYQTFSIENIEDGISFLKTQNPPYVLKADGLAAGKGVIICDSLEKAVTELKEMIHDAKFGDASKKVVIEEFLEGIELSVFIVTDGHSYKILPSAKDYKRIGEGDTGLNTGGMGSISPVPFANEAFMSKVEHRIIKPTIEGLAKEGLPYHGFIFFGLMNRQGNPFLIEYNVRMGDPEAESVIPRIKSDLLQVFEATANGSLHEIRIETDQRFCAAIMLVSKGYPGAYEKGKIIYNHKNVDDSIIFYAGSKIDKDNTIVTNGGRVMAISSFGSDMDEALKKSYQNASIINFEGKYYRKDLGKDLKKYFDHLESY